MNKTIFYIVCGLIVILVAILVNVLIRKNKKKYNDSAAMDFLKGLETVFCEKITAIILGTDLDKYGSLVEAEADIIKQIYDEIWNYVQEQMKIASKTDTLSAIAMKFINKDFVIKFVDTIMDKYHFADKLSAEWGDHYSNAIETSGSNTSEYNDENKYYSNEEVSAQDLPPAENIKPTEEDLAKLKPQTEEEDQNYDVDDNSVELVDPDPVTIVVQRDKNGVPLYYKVDEKGKKTRVSKDYVTSNNLVTEEDQETK